MPAKPEDVATAVTGRLTKRDYTAKLLSLIEYSTNTGGPDALDSTLSVLLLSLMGEFVAPGALVLLPTTSEELEVRAGKGVSRRLLGRRVPCPWNACGSTDDDGAKPDVIETIRTSLALDVVVPIRHHTGNLGLLGVSRRLNHEKYTEAEIELVRLVAGIAGTAVASHDLYDQIRASNRKLERHLFDLHTLFDVSKELNGSLETEGIFRVVVQTAMAHILVTRCIVILEESGVPTVAFERGLNLDETAHQELAKLPNNSAETGDGATTEELLRAWLEPHGVTDLVTLSSGDDTRGYLGIGPRGDKKSLAREHIEFLSTLGNHAITALDNLSLHVDRARRQQLERELGIARSIQQGLLPKELPEIEGYQIAAISEPCYEVGGDYYDVLLFPDHTVLAIADVSGKSVSAALLMSVLQATIRSLAGRPGATPSALLAELNGQLVRSTQASKFVSFFLASIEPGTGRITYTNAGHNAPMLVKRDGTIERLEHGGPVLGIMDDAEFDEGVAILEPGDLFFSYTDGVTEAVDADDEEFGDERLEELLRQQRDLDATGNVDAVLAAVREHSRGLDRGDDLTTLALKRKG